MVTVSLPSDIESYLGEMVAGGKYGSQEEAIVGALRRLRQNDLLYQQLRREVKDALDSVDRGEGIELNGDEELAGFFDDLEAEVQAELAAEKKEEQ
jgi:putative addiction module CopG family antidote